MRCRSRKCCLLAFAPVLAFLSMSLKCAADISVSPTVVSAELASAITITGNFVANTSGVIGANVVSIKSIDNNYVDRAYSPTGYNCMRALNATVIDQHTLQVTTVPTQNAAPGLVKVSTDGGKTWTNSTMLNVTPILEIAVGRRPYTTETEGMLIVRATDTQLLSPNATVAIRATLPSSAFANPTYEGDVPLVVGVARAGRTNVITFALKSLAATVFADLTITATLPSGINITYSKNFQRAPPPENPNVTVFTVDHLTKGLLMSTGSDPNPPWLPFLAVGWFNSAFTYPQEGNGDPSFSPPPAAIDPLLLQGSNRAKEWGRKGVNLITMTARDKSKELLMAMLDHAYRAGLYVLLDVPTPSHCNDTVKPGTPAPNCSADYEYMVSNMTAVKDHPSLFGYYICDDCCQGYHFLKELAVVYEMMKKIDPYHVTAGALECGEMHAFQEPFLSLDTPMRENYRPDLSFHANDGHSRPGSDGDLRMPPMTFEPLINMPDAVRQPRAKFAQTAAWLSLITADMAHQVWYVYNHIMFERWALEDATSAVDAQILELSSSLLGAATTVQPKVTVTDSQNIRARAWRDADFEAQSSDPSHICVHMVVASIALAPEAFSLHISGLCKTASDDPGCDLGTINATHIFTELYSVPVVRSSRGGHELSDVLMPGSTAVYAIGCSSQPKPDPSNLVSDPGFENTQFPLTAGFVGCDREAMYPPGTFKGKCKVEDKHAGSWGLGQQHSLRDSRAALHVDSRKPLSGRHSGRVWLPSRHPVVVGIPGHTTNLDGVHVGNGTSYRVELFARSLPPGMALQVSVGGWKEVDVSASTPLGMSSYHVYVDKSNLSAIELSSNWTRIAFEVEGREWPLVGRNYQVTFNLVLTGPGGDRFDAGEIWIDDVSIRNVSGTVFLPLY